MLKYLPINRLGKAACIIALAFAPTFLHADEFEQINLVANTPGTAANTDPNLINPWGLSFSATSPFWAADQGSGLSTLYSGTGAINSLVVTVPGSATGPSGPTGTVFNGAGTGTFLVGATAASFIFDNLNGTISAWNAGAVTTAQVEATTPGASYTGLAQATTTGPGGATYIYAANSNSTTGSIQVFNSNWTNVTATTFAGKFTDSSIPAGFVPFNVQTIGSNIFVTYAQLTSTGAAMPGGFVVEYDASGNFIKQIAGGGALDAPWGITIAPPGWGSYTGDILVGNFGNGEILVYDITTDTYLGTIDGTNGLPLVNFNLWALDTRTGGTGDNLDAVYFTAGINRQQGGLLGEIVDVPEPPTIFGAVSGVIALALSRIRRFQRSPKA
jgi:uncharacterized protein (TIGR03118 family)